DTSKMTPRTPSKFGDCPEPPSRRSNPFATCWTRPGALPFRFDANNSAEQLVAQLATQNWRGEIVGPHRSGQPTLLEALRPFLAAAGRNIPVVVLRDRQPSLPIGFLHHAAGPPNALIVIDGYEQLARFSRRQLNQHCRRRGAGLLVTSHSPSGLP